MTTFIERLEELKITDSKAPKFVARYTWWENPLTPVRAYIHQNTGRAFDDSKVEDLTAYLRWALQNTAHLTSAAKFSIAFLWGQEDRRMIDLFGYSDIEKPDGWGGNPEVTSYVLENGVYKPERKDITCGDGLIILGDEERHRRRTNSLTEYLESVPVIEGLEAEK